MVVAAARRRLLFGRVVVGVAHTRAERRREKESERELTRDSERGRARERCRERRWPCGSAGGVVDGGKVAGVGVEGGGVSSRLGFATAAVPGGILGLGVVLGSLAGGRLVFRTATDRATAFAFGLLGRAQTSRAALRWLRREGPVHKSCELDLVWFFYEDGFGVSCRSDVRRWHEHDAFVSRRRQKARVLRTEPWTTPCCKAAARKSTLCGAFPSSAMQPGE